ncbi:hypothetical protein QBC34DRAFT_305104 [Podospora aff. communis PSN243]|uniref:DUF7918 domain-containing protein n=1 Tax=Podospora aff. communis PSN243 TaxID=3040156 RepID=A0AAV9GC34_9PEZI|nr:hypothetical protein QBC34DRAFT_305104 [Podospora aff. communis PSN243]
MAVIDHIRGLEVTVEISGKPGKKYDPDGEDVASPPKLNFHIPAHVENGQPQQSPYIVKYIEAQPGARFNFHINRQPTFRHCGDHIAAAVQVDNNHDTANKGTTWSCKIRHWVTFDAKHGYRDCNFRFAKLDIDSEGHTSAQEVKQLLAKVRSLGVLRVALYHMKSSNIENVVCGASDLSSLKNVPEKCLEGRSVDTAASWDIQRSKHQRPFTKLVDAYEDKSKRPFAVFEFRYRSMDGLVKEGIVSRPRIDDEVQEMTDAEARRLARESLELRRVCASVKLEKRSGIEREREEPAPLNDESFQARYKARRLPSGRFEVDLTDDRQYLV